MITPFSVLVVEPDPQELTRTVGLLEAAGYHVASASAFQEAKDILARNSPDLLITGLRLGSYNGLHLVLRSRTDHPEMAAIVTGFTDVVLQAEAQRHQAAYIVKPLRDEDFLSAITRSLQAFSTPVSEDLTAELSS